MSPIKAICIVMLAHVCIQQAPDVPEPVLAVRHSVATITCFNADGEPIGTGSGFFISADRLVTCRHVVQDAYRAVVRLPNGIEGNVQFVTGEDRANDIAVLAVRSVMSEPLNKDAEQPIKADPFQESLKSLVTLRLAGELPRIGVRVYTIGSPYGLEQTIADGIVSALRDSEVIHQFQLSVPASPGSSGSPVVSASGDVIGMVTSKVISGENLNFAVPSPIIKAMKERAPLPLSDWSGVTTLENRKLAESLYQKAVTCDSFILNEEIKSRQEGRPPEQIREKRFEQIGLLRQATALDKRNAAAWELLGHVFVSTKETEEVIEPWGKALDLNPHARCCDMFMSILVQSGRFDEVIDTCRRTLDLNPRAECYEQFGTALARLGRYRDAERELLRGIHVSEEILQECDVRFREVQKAENDPRKDDAGGLFEWVGRSKIETAASALKFRQIVMSRLWARLAQAQLALAEQESAAASAKSAVKYGVEAQRSEVPGTSNHFVTDSGIRMVSQISLAHLVMSEVRERQGANQDAISELRIALPNIDLELMGSANLKLGQLLLRVGDRNGAIEQYKMLTAFDEESAKKLFDEIYPSH